MTGKFVNLTYDACFSYKLKPGEFLNLRGVEQECQSKGVPCKVNKSHLIVDLDGITFQVFSNGRIGWAWLKKQNDAFFFEDSVIPFFWKNFACKCIERRVIVNGK